MISVAQWGRQEGKKWSFKPKSGISEIIIGHSNLILFIKLKGAGDSDYSPIFGFDGCARIQTPKITLDFPSEFLTGLSGFYCTSHIRSIKFHTNRSEYGPFGDSSGSGTPFSFIADSGGVITGFHGHFGAIPNAIGVYVMPINGSNLDLEEIKPQHSEVGQTSSSCLPISGGPWGGSGGREWDDGVLSAVKGVHVQLKSSQAKGAYINLFGGLRFIYKREDGSDFESPVRGKETVGQYRGYPWKRIEFGDDEFLVGIEGFIGPMEGVNMIRSLTFITNKAKHHGPFGDEIGTFFSSMDDCDGDCRKVVGVHGRSGYYLNAIGLHY